MSLGSWGRFLAMIVGASCLIVTIIIVACFVGPGCWGFEYLRREEKKKIINENQLSAMKNSFFKPRPTHWFDKNNFDLYEIGPYGIEKKVSKGEEAHVYHSTERAVNLKCVPLLVTPNIYPTLKTSLPKLEIKLIYTILEDGITCQLTVHIVSASSLPHREYINTLDPFVVLEVLNNKWLLQKHERIVQIDKTNIISNSTNPIFDQLFVFTVKKIEIKNWCLKLTILDNDRLTKATPLFVNRIYLRDIKNLFTSDHVSLNLELQEITANVGSLFLEISYLPTAQRLHINVVKAIKLKYKDLVQSLNEFCPYVRALMLNNHGKCIRKKKTCFKKGEESPVFNTSMIFDLSISNFEQTVFLILLCTKSVCHMTNADNSSSEGDTESYSKEKKDKVLGYIVLGRNVKCIQARDHWVTVMQNPRKTISVWHDLR